MAARQAGIVLRLPIGSPAPAGYQFVRSLRRYNIYSRVAAAPVPQAEIDELEAAFARMGVAAQVQAVDDVNDLAAAIGKMGLPNGGRRRGSKKTRKHRKRHGKRRGSTRRRRA